MNPYLPHTLAHGPHRFPVFGLLASLHLIELIASLAAGIGRKAPQILQAASHPDDRLHDV